MKKLPILTVVYLTLLALAWRGISAYQATAPLNPPAGGVAPAQVPAEKKLPVSDPQAAALVRQARDTLYQRKSVQALVTQTVAVGTFQFRGSGTYTAAEGLRHRLAYTIELGDLRGDYLEVCDSQLLHTQRKITEVNPPPGVKATAENDLRRRDIQRIRLALREQLDKPTDPEAVRNLEIGLGGLPSVLASLERTIIFDGVKREFVDGRDYHLVQGKLNVERAKELLTPLGPLAGQIQGFLPELVRVYLHIETLFPEKILYLKQIDDTGHNFRPMVLVEFTDVKLDEPVAATAFDYPDPGAVERDETEDYLSMLGIRSQPGAGPASPLSPLSPGGPAPAGGPPANPLPGPLLPGGPSQPGAF